MFQKYQMEYRDQFQDSTSNIYYDDGTILGGKPSIRQ